MGIDLSTAALAADRDALGAAAAAVGADPWRWVLGGGEDHALVATFRGSPRRPDGASSGGCSTGRPGCWSTDQEWIGYAGLAVVLSDAATVYAIAEPTMTARPLSELVEAGWASALQPVPTRSPRWGQFLRAEIAAGRRYLPAGPNVLRAFTFPFDDVRVLIVGQDPYPTPGHAVGLSFSVAPEVRPLPRSLANIFRSTPRTWAIPQPSCGDLTPWAQRGVMLLNRVLTVRPSNPASHRGKGWEAVTECAIRALAARSQPLVAILWGRDASTLKPMLARGNCVAIESPHPSPLSASRGFFGSRPFSRANELLAEMGADAIDWRLP